MKRFLYSLLILAVATLAGPSASAQRAGATPPTTYAEKVQRYIATYKDLAMQEQQRSGIPAAITLAQGILESGAGESELATEAANHFGIKCKSAWTGETYNHDDDAPDECFRKYTTAEASYRDHTDYLKSAGRYTPCFAQSTTDYAAWAHQLKTCGYATSPTYAQRLIRIIEDYKLQQYTYAALDSQDPLRNAVAGEVVPEADAAAKSSPAPTASTQVLLGEKPIATADPQRSTESSRLNAHSETPQEARAREQQAHAADATPVAVSADGTTTKDGRRGFYAKTGDVLLEDAIRHRIRYAKLLEINGLPDEPLSTDRFIFLEKATTTRLEHDVAAIASHDETASVAPATGRPRRVTGDATMQAEAVSPEVLIASAEPAVPVRNEQTVPGSQPENSHEVSPRAEASPIAPDDPTAQDAAITAAEIPGRVPEERPVPEALAVERTEPRAAAVTASSTAVETRGQRDIRQENFEPAEERAAAPELIATTAPVETALDAQAAIPAGAEATPPPTAPAGADAINIAAEAAVEEGAEENSTPAAVVAEPEPKDEMSRLKARFDKAVYAPVKSSSKTSPAAAAPETSAPVNNGKAPNGVKAAPVVASSASAAKFYTVQKGDTAFGIAKKHGITVRQLQEWNGLAMDAGVPMGKKLKVQP